MSWAHDIFKALTGTTAYTITFTPPLNTDTLILTFGDLNRKWGSDTHEIAELPPPPRSAFLFSNAGPERLSLFYCDPVAASDALFILGHLLIRCFGRSTSKTNPLMISTIRLNQPGKGQFLNRCPSFPQRKHFGGSWFLLGGWCRWRWHGVGDCPNDSSCLVDERIWPVTWMREEERERRII